jgi:predicted nuclease with TOPRIM domain
VSFEYWRELTLRYAEHLANLSSEKCLPYYLTINKDINLIDFYVKRNDIDNALIIAKMNELKNENAKKLSFFRLEDNKNESKQPEDNDLDNEIMETDGGHTEGSKRDIVRTVNIHAALRFLTLSKPIHAAAQVYL